MKMFENLPWFGYIILIVVVASYAYRYFKIGKDVYDAPDLMNVKFMKDGRCWYFDFIYNMINTEPEENWKGFVNRKFGDNERAQRYLNLLKTGTAQEALKTKRFITFDSEIEIGVAAYDASVLVGQARRALTANLICEQEAWKAINFAT